ncbi:hypothetical protein D3C84_1136010 [compost metagenome]
MKTFIAEHSKSGLIGHVYITNFVNGFTYTDRCFKIRVEQLQNQFDYFRSYLRSEM